MIPSADHDPIRSYDLAALVARARSAPPDPVLTALIAAARKGDGMAMERLERRLSAS